MRRSAGVQADGPDVIWVEHDNTSTSYVRGIRGEPRDFLRTRDVLTWSIQSSAWRWTALDMDFAHKKLYLADTVDRSENVLTAVARADEKTFQNYQNDWSGR